MLHKHVVLILILQKKELILIKNVCVIVHCTLILNITNTTILENIDIGIAKLEQTSGQAQIDTIRSKQKYRNKITYQEQIFEKEIVLEIPFNYTTPISSVKASKPENLLSIEINSNIKLINKTGNEIIIQIPIDSLNVYSIIENNNSISINFTKINNTTHIISNNKYNNKTEIPLVGKDNNKINSNNDIKILNILSSNFLPIYILLLFYIIFCICCCCLKKMKSKVIPIKNNIENNIIENNIIENNVEGNIIEDNI